MRACLCACANENDGEKGCYAEMNERNDIYILKSRKKQSRINLWRSVFLWRCATHWSTMMFCGEEHEVRLMFCGEEYGVIMMFCDKEHDVLW